MKNQNPKQFVMLGVNSDTKERLQKVVRAKTVPWRSWWDGGDTSGPITTRWNIRSWPTVYLLDRKGIIRFKGENEDFDDLLKQLLNE